ncbi:hypothetical protein DL93DRAFT_2088205 [Clavulina sp. PMI_390]|nr:hypothetical protein DL93DRAFT_2088205 [Clavulina sp. PMI_390]
MAEMDVYHTQKNEDLAAIAEDHLRGEIEYHEQVSLIARIIFFHLSYPFYRWTEAANMEAHCVLRFYFVFAGHSES